MLRRSTLLVIFFLALGWISRGSLATYFGLPFDDRGVQTSAGSSGSVGRPVTGAAKPPQPPQRPLVERLGFAADAKVLIINGDDFGMNHASSVATSEALRSGGLTSATIMVPCAWFPWVAEFASRSPRANLGIHLTLTSEWQRYRWGPVSGPGAVPGLVDKLGFLYPNPAQVYAHATLAEVEVELRAQLDRALAAGIDVTHLDSHMGTLQFEPSYHELYLRIAKLYALPCRIAGPDLMGPRKALFLIEMADELGVIHPDFLYVKGPPRIEQTAEFWRQRLRQLRPGFVSEIFIHAALPSAEMKATTCDWRQRAADSEFFSSSIALAAIKAAGVELISYRELRYLQRHGEPMPRQASFGW